MENKPKINERKLEQATAILREIMTLTNRYNELLKELNPREKALAGGIVFRIRNIWDDIGLVGIMVDRTMAGEMIDTLIGFFQHPERFGGMGDKPLIQTNSKMRDDLN